MWLLPLLLLLPLMPLSVAAVAAVHALALRPGFPRRVLAEEGMAKAVAFDEIDKAPEEKARGITIATAHGGLDAR